MAALRFIGGPVDGAEAVLVPEGGGPYHVRFAKTASNWIPFIGETPFVKPRVLARYNQSGRGTYTFKRYEWINQDE